MKLSEVTTHLTPNPQLPSASNAVLVPGFIPDFAPVESLVRGVQSPAFARIGVISLSECPKARLNGLGELVQVVT
jgi:hypothetical protein